MVIPGFSVEMAAVSVQPAAMGYGKSRAQYHQESSGHRSMILHLVFSLTCDTWPS